MIEILCILCVLVLALYLIEKRLETSFKALSYDVLEKNGKQFLNMADAALQPICQTMQTLDKHQRELEKTREGAYAALSKQIEGLIYSEKMLRQETVRLSQALKSPQARGSWGEVHLRRVVELAGLAAHCDFDEQKTLVGIERVLRPDLIVKLPGNRSIAVDAKAPLSSYLEACDTEDEEWKKKKLFEHAQLLRKHMKELSAKQYWKELDPSPEFVVLFLPAEAFFSAAIAADPTLIEVGADQNVVIATPTTLIAILRAVAYGWKQESIAESAKEISRLGQELYDRIGIVTEHWNKVGRSLNTAVESYNQASASLETRLLVSARKLKETAAISKELSSPEAIEKQTRGIYLN